MQARPVLFWSHLVAGVLAGLIILMMSVTGVILTYERQIVGWAEQSHAQATAKGRAALSADELLAIARETEPQGKRVTLTYRKDSDSFVKIVVDRNPQLLVDPYTGSILYTGETGAEGFLDTVMYVHRWFALSGDSRATGRAVTGFANLMFLFLLVSGIYLWLPRIWNRAILKTRMVFNPRAKTGKARDYNWHHVFAFWSFIPLFFIITTASVFYYPWANELVFGVYGEEVQSRRRGSDDLAAPVAAPSFRSQQELLSLAKAALIARGVGDWESISMQTTGAPGAPVVFRADRSIGGQPSKAFNLKLDGIDGSVLEWGTFADNSPGRRARINIRFLHTGEVLGFVGQTVAGLASLAACLMVWTGLALAWRRLIRPLFRRGRTVAGTES
ncbi:MAG: PepSY domain-containing protein [Gammaproteobacteria bacterium]|nr:PepSY domain-containing protein [Gammaproteobacteria bacterium]